MALVKIQIWSPDQVNSLGGFKTFGSSSEPHEDNTATASGFQVSPEYIRDLMVDPQVKVHLESVIEERTKKDLIRILSSYHSIDSDLEQRSDLETLSLSDLSAELKRLEEGLANRWKNMLEKIQEQRSSMESAWEQVLAEWRNKRESLLQVHERQWCETLGYVAQKSCLNSGQFRLEDIEKWLRLNVSDFLDKDNITIYLNPKQYQALRTDVDQQPTPKKWTVMEDPELQEGQIRFETGNAGVIFDDKKNLEKILGWTETR